MHCYSVLAETGRITGFLAAIRRVSMRSIREAKSQPRPMRGLAVASAHHCALAARFTLNCAGLAHCQAAPGRAHRLRCACAQRDVWRQLSGGYCVPWLLGACATAPAPRAGNIRAASRRLRAPRPGGSAAPAHAAAACCSSASAPAPVQRRIKGRGG
jgi:hypothetical protein